MEDSGVSGTGQWTNMNSKLNEKTSLSSSRYWPNNKSKMYVLEHAGNILFSSW